jgi:hypothetical protein
MPTWGADRAHPRTHGPGEAPICSEFRSENAIFYAEFDGRRPKRLLVKVIGE